jgi:hypothetical protein
MAIKIGINGFGRIGRLVFRQIYNMKGIDVVAINDLTSPAVLAHLLKYDSAQGRFNQDVTSTENSIKVKGEEIKIVDEHGASLPDCPPLLSALLPFTSPGSWAHKFNLHVQLAASMRAHGHGGSLLVVPKGSEAWRESILHPIFYSVTPAFSALAELMRQEVNDANENLLDAAVRRAVDTVAGLTAVDGATVINDEYEVLAFGAKIRRPEGSSQVEQMVATEPVAGDQPIVIHPAQNGGTRHLSAAQFVHDQRDAVALVASQDGRFTVFAWSPCEQMVHAHRIDTLLL